MIFFNFFTNFAGTNQLSNRQPYIDLISKLLNFEDTESGYYSSDFATQVANEIQAPQNTRIRRPGGSYLSLEVVKALNPTLFKDQESTLPIMNGLVLLDTECGNALASRYPAASFYQKCLSLSTGGQHAGHGWRQGEVPEDSAKIAQYLSGEHNQTNQYLSSNRQPNLFAANFYKAYKASVKLNKKIHINKETHKQLLDDQGNLCVVDTLRLNPRILSDEEIDGQFGAFRRLRDFISITLALKSTSEEVYQTQFHLKDRENPLDETFVDNLRDDISEKSIKCYRETRKTDIDPRFEHLNFDRLTNDLFEQTEDSLISQLNAIDAVSFNNYIKQNHIAQVNDKEVFSFFSKDFYKKFLHIKSRKGSHEDAALEPIIENIIVLDNMTPINLGILPETTDNGSHHWNFSSRFTRNEVKIIPSMDSSKDYLPLGSGFGLTFAQGKQKTVLCQEIASLRENRVVGIIFNGFTKVTSKESFEFISLTKRQASIRKGFFIPMLFPIEYRDSEFEIKNGYSFSLVCLTSSFNEMMNKKRSRDALYNFISYYQDGQGLYFYNKSKHLALQKDLVAGLVEYSEWLIPSFKKFAIEDIKKLKDALEKKKKKMKALESNIAVTFLDSLSSVPNINPVIKRKYNKVSTHYKRLLRTNSTQSDEINSFANNMANDLSLAGDLFRQIEELKKRTKEMEESAAQHLTTLKSHFNSRMETSNTIIANQELYDSVKTRYDAAYRTAIDNKNYSTNGFFKNILDRSQISICSLKVVDKSDKGHHPFDYTSKHFINNNPSGDFKSKYKITEVTFLINSPIIINVDNGAKGQVCGGPYAIKVDPTALKIALAYPSSIHGVNEKVLFVHPHASTVQMKEFVSMFGQDDFKWLSGCLGEASALLHSAFKENNLKTIILAALTWVKSANSADTWGKNYQYFPTPDKLIALQEETKSETILEESINEDDVNDFLESMIEETVVEAPPEEAAAEPPTLDIVPLLTPLPQDENQTQGFTPDQFAQPAPNYTPTYGTPTT